MGIQDTQDTRDIEQTGAIWKNKRMRNSTMGRFLSWLPSNRLLKVTWKTKDQHYIHSLAHSLALPLGPGLHNLITIHL